jgi:hypothetical protein
LITQQGSNPKLHVPAMIDLLLTIANQTPQFTDVLRSQPDFGQVPDTFQVGQQLGGGPIGFVRALLDPGDVSRVGQIDRPAGVVDQFFSEVSLAAAGLDGGENGSTHGNYLGDRLPFVGPSAVLNDVALLVHDTHLDAVLVIVQAHVIG